MSYKRKLVIGDIHGGLKGLEQVIQQVSLTDSDTLIFLGDYVDGWSASAQVIQYLLQLNTFCQCIFLKGNHDIFCKNWLENKSESEDWLAHGGISTIESYRRIASNEIELHIDFFNNMVNYYIDDENRLFIHAGFTSLKGPQHEFYSGMLYWDRTLWETAFAVNQSLSNDDYRYPKRLQLFKEIYIGHTPTTLFNESRPMKAENLWNMDTGAGFKGKISIMDIDTKQVWQSDPLPELYPDEKGRNNETFNQFKHKNSI